jgi:hypothetical protein
MTVGDVVALRQQALPAFLDGDARSTCSVRPAIQRKPDAHKASAMIHNTDRFGDFLCFGGFVR